MINLAETMFIYATTRFDDYLAKLEPPAFATIDENTPEDVVALLKTAGNSAARQYDKYKEIKQISCLYGNECLHLVLACETPVSLFQVNPGSGGREAEIRLVATEGELVAGFWDWFRARGVAGPAVVAGWRTSQLWALLVNKAIRYKLPVPPAWRQDPMKKWGSTDRLLDLSHIYLQGVSPAVRLMPDLQDALDYWDIPDPNKHKYTYPTQKELRSAPDTGWGEMALRLELYLDGMRRAMSEYMQEEPDMGGVHGITTQVPNLRGPAGPGIRAQ